MKQAYGRGPKGTLDVLEQHLREVGSISNTAAAEEIGSQALACVKLFDRIFASKINNTCKCQIGARPLVADGNHLLEDLYKFYTEFQEPITDCEVNGFLNLSNDHSRVQTLFSDANARKCDSVMQLQEYAASNKHITCRECGKIGDAVVALEQPASWCLVHLDKAYKALCPALGREQKAIASLQAVEKINLDPAGKKAADSGQALACRIQKLKRPKANGSRNWKAISLSRKNRAIGK